MRIAFAGILVLVLIACCITGVLAMAMENTRAAIQQPHWPTGLADLLNSRKWVYSYWINSIDHYYYAGDVKAFNAFVQKYSKLGGAARQETLLTGQTITIQQDSPQLMLVLHSGYPLTGHFDIPDKSTISYDWSVEINGWSSAQVNNQSVPVLALWTGGKVKLANVNVPLNVEVRADYPVTAEMTKFVAAHEAKRAKGK